MLKNKFIKYFFILINNGITEKDNILKTKKTNRINILNLVLFFLLLFLMLDSVLNKNYLNLALETFSFFTAIISIIYLVKNKTNYFLTYFLMVLTIYCVFFKIIETQAFEEYLAIFILFSFLIFSCFSLKGALCLIILQSSSLLAILFFPSFQLDSYLVYEKIKYFIIYSFSVIVALCWEFIYLFNNEKLNLILKKLRKQSETDPLTSLNNRRFFYKEISSEIFRYKRSKRAFSLLMCDLDDFKQINDTYTHQCGDIVLKNFAGILKNNSRNIDILSRWGGEEFLLLLPETNLEGAIVKAELIRKKFESLITNCNNNNFKMTVSIGVMEYDPRFSIKELIQTADKKLYEAKQKGKNIVCF